MSAIDSRTQAPERHQARHDLVERARQRDAGTPEQLAAWAVAIAGELEEVGASSTETRSICSDLAWHHRSLGLPIHSAPDVLRALDGSGQGSSSTARLVVQYVVSQRLRFNFLFTSIITEAQQWPDVGVDAQLQAIRTFAELALGTQGAHAALTTLRERHDHDAVTRDIMLHGVWFAYTLPDQAHTLLALSDEMLARGEASSNLYFRRAYAHRNSHAYDAALRDIYVAMELLGPGANDIHQDYAREREAIVNAATVEAEIEAAVQQRLDEALEAIESRTTRAEDSVARSMVSVIEVLALFVALVGFIGAGAVTMYQDLPFWRQLVTMVVLLGGIIGFIFVLRAVITHPVRRRRR